MELNKDNNLEELKKEYEKFKDRYNLPEFNELNELFDIEEVYFESDFLLRKIRRFISEKMLAYSKFVEIILNPSNAPLFFFKLMKKLDNKDKEKLANIYDELGKIEVETIGMDLEYNEKKEAEFIDRMYKNFSKEIKPKLSEIVKKLGNGDNNKQFSNGTSYFG